MKRTSYSGQFVKESFGDNYTVRPLQKFTKKWTFKNEGKTAWSEDTLFMQTNGDNLEAEPVPINYVVDPGQEYEWEIELIAPEKEGKYSAFFRMITGNNYRFGHKVWCTIIVESEKEKEQKFSEE